MKPLENILSFIPGKMLKSIICVSLAAQLATGLLTAVLFQRIGGWGFLPYLVLVPIVTAGLGLGVLGMILSPTTALASWILQLHGICMALLIKGASLIAALPGATLRVTSPTLATLTIFTAGLILFRLSMGRKRFIPIWGTVMAVAVLAHVAGPGRLADHKLTVCFIDVGNADAILIRAPSGETLLVDGGGIFGSDFDVGRNVVAPTLRYFGVRTLDAVVVTHPHPDHQLGIKSVLKEVAVKAIWVRRRSVEDPDHQEIMELADSLGIPIRELDADPLLEDLRLNTNNRSIVLGIEYGQFRMLLPGDAEREAESGLLAYGDLLHSDVLKAGHHGSRTSCSQPFLELVHPQLVHIPCGKNNHFGHPHQVTLNRLQALHPEPVIRRADRNGMLLLVSNADTYSVKSFFFENSF